MAAGCAATRPAIDLPRGDGTPYPRHADALAEAVNACRGVRTMEFLLALRGRRGETSLRGRVRGAVARPGSLRLEGLAPFGAPRFVLAAAPEAATLLLPRARQVVRDAHPREMLYALAGLPLAPDDLRAVLTGCVVPEPRSIAGRAYGDDWIAVDLAGGATAFLRPIDGGLTVVAGARGPLTVAYEGHVRGLPRRVRVLVEGAGASAGVDLTADLSQVSINTTLHPEVFAVTVGASFQAVALEELTGGTPLRDPAGPPDPARSTP
ncbi:MAG: hypothetical protein OXH69_20665 [Acidobacteria bacterium]|nr:hypothetical protein [Acidobacteriota bacterium]